MDAVALGEAQAAEAVRRAAEPLRAADLCGLFVANYGGHGPEVVHVALTGEGALEATKVTGDSNVPAGEVTWHATLDSGVARGSALVADVQVADSGFENARRVRGWTGCGGDARGCFSVGATRGRSGARVLEGKKREKGAGAAKIIVAAPRVTTRVCLKKTMQQ